MAIVSRAAVVETARLLPASAVTAVCAKELSMSSSPAVCPEASRHEAGLHAASRHEAASRLPRPVDRLNQLLLGQFISRSIYLASDLEIADRLRDGPLSIDELATRTGSNPDALYRLLRALAAIGVFEEHPERSFSNSELSTYLRRDVAGSLGPMASWLGDNSGWTAWGRLDHSVRTGKPAFDHVFGSDCFTWMQTHEQTLHVFQSAMSGYTALTSGAVLEAYDFTSAGTVLDVGGGHGGLLSQILQRA